MFGLKGYIYGAVIVGILSGGSYIAYTWHYAVISRLEKKVISLEEQLEIIGASYNMCEANLSKQALEGFISGVWENNETIVTSLDNLST